MPTPDFLEGARPVVSLRVPKHRVARRAILWWSLQVVITALTVLGAIVLLLAFVPVTRPVGRPVLAVLAVLYLLTLAVMPTWRYLVHHWEYSGTAVYSLKGWLIREWQLVPISRIQSVDVIKGPLENVLGLATVRVTTASPEGTIRIIGLEPETAAKAASELTELTQATTGDAT